MATQATKAGKWVRFSEAVQIPEGDHDTLRWFVSMRYRIALVLLLILIVSYLLGVVPADSGFNMLCIDLVYLLSTVLCDTLLRRNPSPSLVRFLRMVQLPEKLVVCTVAIYLSGGVLTPVVMLYPLGIIEAIILTDSRGVYRTGALAVACYLSLSMLEAYNFIPYVHGHWGGHDFHETATAVTYALHIIVVSALLLVIAFMGNRISRVMSQRNRQIKNQLQDLRTLYDVAKGLGNILDENEMLQYLANTLQSLQNATTCVISMVNKDGLVAVRATGGVDTSTLANLRPMCIDTYGLGVVFRDGDPLILNNIDEAPQYKPLLVNPTIKSAYLFPIKVDNKVIGSISLGFDVVQDLSPEYSTLLTTIAAQAGVALQRADLFTGTERLAREMSVLYDVGLYTGSTLSRDEVIRRTSGTIEKLMNPDAYYIALYDDGTNMLSFEVFMEGNEVMPKMRMTLGRGGLTARIIESCKPVLIRDWLADGQEYTKVANKTGTDMLSYLGVPMIAEDKVVGVLSVQSEQALAFDDHHERLLTALAAQTAMALENARLHQLAQEQARFDSLTKTYNHGHFVTLVRQSVEDSDRDDSCVALIMLDIDHFKKYNDTFGHVAGDNVLRMVANALKSSVSDTGFVGRWGGEEFCVLLPGAGPAEAKKTARYIRRAISELYPVDGHGQLIPNPTVSQGISSYPFPSATPNELIEEADTALYQAKKRGRNQLIVYEAKGVLKEATTTTGSLTTGNLGQMTLITRDRKMVTTGNLAGSYVPPSDGGSTNPRLS